MFPLKEVLADGPGVILQWWTETLTETLTPSLGLNPSSF